ncbi:MAG TPA: UDP-N-acetylglucosamine-1-phosphate transferase [Nitrososphaeraceae archaeon]|nr:UDP-N-acetylglucosamine-1-phosphate transferase [Nitrososphaeraceae archaeon]
MLDVYFGYNIPIYGITVSAISFFVILFTTPKIISSLIAKGEVVEDHHKPDKPPVPRPAGPVLLIGIAVAEIVLYLLTLNIKVIAILFTSVIAFIVGFIDDRKVMPGWFKPIALIAAAIPLIVLGAHGTHLNLVFGSAFIPLLYIPLILVIISTVGNTINSIDVFNGVATGFVIIAMIPLLASIAIFGSNEAFIAALPLLFGTIAFYKYHKYPSKIFPGDSGTLLMGAMYGAVAIIGNSEIIGTIALLPAVMNSFLFLATVKKIVEHRQVKVRPVVLTDDFKLAATKEKNAPITLVRLILLDGPLSEKEIGYQIFKLAIFTSMLAFISIVIQYSFLSGVLHL